MLDHSTLQDTNDRFLANIQRDLQYLTRLWQNIDKKMKSGPGDGCALPERTTATMDTPVLVRRAVSPSVWFANAVAGSRHV